MPQSISGGRRCASQTSNDAPRPKRKRINRPAAPSIYVQHALGQLDRPDDNGRGKDKGKQRTEGEGEVDERHKMGDEADEGEMRRRMYRERTVKGWRTRKMRTGESALFTVTEPENGEESEDTRPKDLPNDDLLRALHHHASTFYASHSLMLYPSPRRRRPEHAWPSKKRLEIEGGSRGGPWGRQSGSSHGARPLTSRRHTEEPIGTRSRNEDKVESGDGDSEENDERDGSKPMSRGPKRGVPRGPYKKRDMYGALDGTALLTLGILVEEYVKWQLELIARPEADSGDAGGEGVDELIEEEDGETARDKGGSQQAPAGDTAESDSDGSEYG